MALTTKQRAFVEAYLANGFNATQAALTAGYSQKTAYSQGSRLLKNVEVKAAIEARMRELTMSADEAMFRLSQQAAATMEDFLSVEGETISLAKAERAGKLHLIKKFTHHIGKETENISIELYDAQAALALVLKEQHLRNGEATERSEVRVDLDGAKERLAHLVNRHAATGAESGGSSTTDE